MWLLTRTRMTRPPLSRCRHTPASSNPSVTAATFATRAGTSSGGRMSAMVIRRNSSRAYPYLATAASFTVRKASVSRSYAHIGCGFASNSRRYRSSLARSVSSARLRSVTSWSEPRTRTTLPCSTIGRQMVRTHLCAPRAETSRNSRS